MHTPSSSQAVVPGMQNMEVIKGKPYRRSVDHTICFRFLDCFEKEAAYLSQNFKIDKCKIINPHVPEANILIHNENFKDIYQLTRTCAVCESYVSCQEY